MVGAEPHRPVLDQRFRMHQPVLEAERIDEGFKRGAGRAQRLRHVHLAGALPVEIIGRCDARTDFAGGVIDRDNGDGYVAAERLRALARERLQIALQMKVDGQAMLGGVGRRRHRLIGGMRSQRRHRLARLRHRFQLCERDLVGGNEHGGGAVEHAVARHARDLRRAVGPARFRRLRQRYQQSRLMQRQPLRLLAEIGQRGGAHAFKIAAIGGKAEIERKDVALGQRGFELDRARHLPQLGGEAALAARLQQARDLHGQRRAAGDDAPVGREQPRRTHQRQRIDAAMRIKAFVLVGDEQCNEARIDVVGRGLEAPAALRRRIGPQQPALAIDNLRGIAQAFPARRRPERDEPGSAARKNSRTKKNSGGDCNTQARPRSLPVPSPLSAESQGGGKS